MAETRSDDRETALPAKRKPDLTSSDAPEDPPAKAPKAADKINGAAHAGAGADAPQAGDNGEAKAAAAADASGGSGDGKGEVKAAVVGEEDEEDDEDYRGGEGVQKVAEPAVVDVKGKGIVKVDKGKEKLLPGESWEDESDGGGDGSDSDDDDDDSSSDSDSDEDSGSDSDLADDPLAEVDLDNILPSRTRYRRGQSGIVINEKFIPWSGGDGKA